MAYNINFQSDDCEMKTTNSFHGPFSDKLHIPEIISSKQKASLRKRISIVDKQGRHKIDYQGKKLWVFFKGLFITLVELKWHWVLLSFLILYFLVFLVFSILYAFVCWVNGDFEHMDESGYLPCVVGFKGFAGLMLFSIETQTSIGYGDVHPNTECPGSLIIVFLHITFGLVLETFLLSYVVAKLFRPSLRSNTIIFSKKAVISQEDGSLCLQIRVGDLREKPLQSAVAYGILVKEHVTEEGVVYPLYQHELSFTADAMIDEVCLAWPVILSHKITNSSPLWNIVENDLHSEKFQIIVFIEGVEDSAGEMCQMRTSYTEQEIVWGYRFEPLMEFNKVTKRWCIDFTHFDKINFISIPSSQNNVTDQNSSNGHVTKF